MLSKSVASFTVEMLKHQQKANDKYNNRTPLRYAKHFLSNKFFRKGLIITAVITNKIPLNIPELENETIAKTT